MSSKKTSAKSTPAEAAPLEKAPRPTSSAAQAEAFLSTVDEMVYFQGLDGSLDLLNDAIARITGYSLEEWQDNPQLWRDIVHPEDQETAEAFFAEFPDGIDSFEVDYRLRRKSGEWRWIQSRMVGVKDDSGRYIGYNCVDRDITEHKNVLLELEEHRNRLDLMVEERSRELIEAKQAAERASRSKTLFLANMSHEIRTPMNAVLGFSHLLAQSTLDGDQSRYLKAIQRNAESLLGVIDDILDLSRIEVGQIELSPEPFELRSLVDEVVERFSQPIHSKGLDLRWHIDPEVPSTLVGDPSRLGQILNNLFGNAIKFTSKGSISLTVSMVEHSDDEVTLRMKVQDTGMGMASEDTLEIFESFSQIDGSSTRRHGGAGLGLAIAKQLCALMDGDIGAQSELGKGSTFWFTARLGLGVDSETSPSLPSAAPELPAPGLHILVVEDNAINQEVAAAILESMGHTYSVVSSGSEALEFLEQSTCDLVLMDVQMPRMDGFETTRAIRRREARQEVEAPLPIIAVTAHAMAGDRERCLEAGMDDYLSKPIQPEKLEALLRSFGDGAPKEV